MKCPNCDELVQPSNQYCWNCGCPIPQRPASQLAKTQRLAWIAPVVTGIALTIALLLVGILMFENERTILVGLFVISFLSPILSLIGIYRKKSILLLWALIIMQPSFISFVPWWPYDVSILLIPLLQFTTYIFVKRGLVSPLILSFLLTLTPIGTYLVYLGIFSRRFQ